MTICNCVRTSDSVSEGHPDKLSDRIADALLGSFLAADPGCRVTIETSISSNQVVLTGEVDGPQPIDDTALEEVTRRVIRDIGYEQYGFPWQSIEVVSLVRKPSSDGFHDGGNPGTFFGYACCETPALMPAPIYFSNKILERLAAAYHNGTEPEIGPDAKLQLSIRYQNGAPTGVTSIVFLSPHLDPDFTSDDLRALVEPYIFKTLPDGWISNDTEWWVDRTDMFASSPLDDEFGLSGSKILADTYGGAAPHGRGGFSGKDPSQVNRSAAYAARYLAKNVVAAGLAERCTVQLACDAGASKPLSLSVDGHGTNRVDEKTLKDVLMKTIDLSPRGIREHLALNRPVYERTAAYGHFGREPDTDGGFSWERTDLIDAFAGL